MAAYMNALECYAVLCSVMQCYAGSVTSDLAGHRMQFRAEAGQGGQIDSPCWRVTAWVLLLWSTGRGVC